MSPVELNKLPASPQMKNLHCARAVREPVGRVGQVVAWRAEKRHGHWVRCVENRLPLSLIYVEKAS